MVVVSDGWVVVRRPPGRHDLGAGIGVEVGEQALVVSEREERRRIGVAKLSDEACVVGKRIADIEAFAFEPQDLGGAGDGVEAHGVGGLPAAPDSPTARAQASAQRAA